MEFFNHITLLTAGAVVVIQELLSLKFIPSSFANRFPIPTLIVLSTLAALLTVFLTNQQATPHTVGDWILLVSTIGVVAAVTYNHTIRQWTDLRAMEGPVAPKVVTTQVV